MNWHKDFQFAYCNNKYIMKCALLFQGQVARFSYLVSDNLSKIPLDVRYTTVKNTISGLDQVTRVI